MIILMLFVIGNNMRIFLNKLITNDEGKPYLEVINNDPNMKIPIALLYFEEYP